MVKQTGAARRTHEFVPCDIVASMNEEQATNKTREGSKGSLSALGELLQDSAFCFRGRRRGDRALAREKRLDSRGWQPGLGGDPPGQHRRRRARASARPVEPVGDRIEDRALVDSGDVAAGD